jgi:hypothetical protein
MAVDGILTLQKKLLCQRFVCDLCHALLIDAVALPECAHECKFSCVLAASRCFEMVFVDSLQVLHCQLHHISGSWTLPMPEN